MAPDVTNPLASTAGDAGRPGLALHLLGAPRIFRDGGEMAVDTRKALALVAYLARTGQRHSRDTLAALLWPDYDPAHARATLRRTLSALNKAMGGQALLAGRETIGLDHGPGIWVDVAEFERLAASCRQHGHAVDDVCAQCVAPLSDAARLYVGDFLAGFSVRESAEFEEWQFFQAQGLRRELAGVLERLARACAARGEFEPAIAHARRWLALDRLHEPAHRELMRLYNWAGQRAAALRQYRACVQILDQELGVPPLDETTHLYEVIKEGADSAPPALVAVTPPPDGPRQTAASVPGQRNHPSEHSAAFAADGPSGHLERHDPGGHSAAAKPTDDHATGVAHEPDADVEHPLVGRAEEWDRIRMAYEASAAGGRVVAIIGEPGIGKTRLAEELLGHARDRGARTVGARCYEGESTLAYGPIAAGLRSVIGLDERRRALDTVPAHALIEASRLVPEFANARADLSRAPSLDTPGARGRFFEGIRDVLVALLKGSAPGVFFVDDLQWADSATIDLIAYLARRLGTDQVCLLFTWRADEIATERRLGRLVADHGPRVPATVISLHRFTRPLVGALITAMTATGTKRQEFTPPEFADRMFEESEGLPLFVVEYLTALRDGTVAERAGDWAIPGGVRGLLRSRMSGVGGTAAQVLTAAAVIGRSFDFDTLRAASGRSEVETIDGLDELLGRGLIRESRGESSASPTYDFAHEKLRAVVYEEASLARRRLLHRRVADALAARQVRSAVGGPAHQDRWTQPGRIAHHYLLGGSESMAADYFIMAAERAREVYANAEAMAHFQTALALGHGDSASLHQALGDLHTLQGEYAAALKSYETAAALDAGPNIAVVERKLGEIYARRGEWDLAESHFQAAVEPGDPHRGIVSAPPDGSRPPAALDELARTFVAWSLTVHHRGDTQRAGKLAQRALSLAETTGDARALAQVHNILGILATSNGHAGEALQHLERSLKLADESGDSGARAAALNNLALVYGASGDTARALASAEAALVLCRERGDRHREAALLNNIADLLHRTGRADEARERVVESVSILAEISAEGGDPRPAIWKLAEW